MNLIEFFILILVFKLSSVFYMVAQCMSGLVCFLINSMSGSRSFDFKFSRNLCHMVFLISCHTRPELITPVYRVTATLHMS